jgi:predicted XRE-type DNA-binding protein
MKLKNKPIPTNPTPSELYAFYSSLKTIGNRDCWITPKKPSSGGYCYVSVRGVPYAAHRLSYAWRYGIDPGEMLVCHKCDNPPCCNPAHLFLGTSADNTRDAQDKGRLAHGSRTGTAKLTESQVAQIRRMLSESIYDQQQIAQMFGISTSLVSAIKQGATWRHVADTPAPYKSHNRGSRHKLAKLTEEQVSQIHQLLVESELDQQAIGEMFGVSQASIALISAGKSWKHVTRPRGKHKRNIKGVKHPSAMFTNEQILEIRMLYTTGLHTQREIADRFQTTQSNIGSIVRGENWSHLPTLPKPSKRKSNQLTGEAHPDSKLSDKAIADIRGRIGKSESQASIAREYGVSPAIITRIKQGKR